MLPLVADRKRHYAIINAAQQLHMYIFKIFHKPVLHLQATVKVHPVVMRCSFHFARYKFLRLIAQLRQLAPLIQQTRLLYMIIAVN